MKRRYLGGGKPTKTGRERGGLKKEIGKSNMISSTAKS